MPVQVQVDGQPLRSDPGPTLFDCADQVGVQVPTSCHKNGKCHECLVEVVDGMEHLSSRTPEEAHLQNRFRLACRAQVVATEGYVRIQTLRRGRMSITDNGVSRDSNGEAPPHDPAVTRASGTIMLDGKPIASSSGPLLGIATDLGTTTVVMRLVDLETGNVIEAQSFENPQRFGGSDVMARIQYDTEHKGRLLQRTLLGYMAKAVEAFDCDTQSIYEMVVVGNPTMRDLLFGLDVHSIGQRPYQSITQHEREAGERDSTCLTSAAKNLRLPMHPMARIQSLPLIHGHVGADAAACLLAVDLPHDDRVVALMDMGTNTELLVGNHHKMLAASCPAGPAFEGGGIRCGMPAFDGAIESLRIDEEGSVAFRVIGETSPEGFCGSGLVELLGELRRTDRMTELGRYVDESHQFDVSVEHRLSLGEDDISLLAQAKGANAAGLQIVMRQYGIDMDRLDRFYLAGGFARHMNIAAARRIGLIPDLPDTRISQIGNAAIEGATIALNSVTKRRELEELVQRIAHVELESDDNFFDCFVEGCQFKPICPMPAPLG